jgi:CelD/BcsL family acetyltransferase involved in cellulose biosynthesis
VSSLGKTGLPAATAGVTWIEKITDMGGLHALRAEWTDLLESSASDCVFLTWEWLSTWWKHRGGGKRLDVIAVRQGDELIGLAPLMVIPPRPGRLVPSPTRQFLASGNVGSDYLDVIVRKGRELEALSALASQLDREGLMLDLMRVNRRSAAALLLAGELEQRGWRLSEGPGDVCPFIDLAGHTWNSYLASFDAKHRYNVKHRLDRLMKQFDMRFERVQSEEQRREALAALVALHRERWTARGGSTALDAASLVAFHEEFSRLALERGWLRLYVMRLEGKPVAALYGFRYRHAFCFYQTGFAPAYSRHGVGQVTLSLTIKDAIEDGASEYDMLHGDEPYKFDWTRQVRELGRLELYPPSARGWLCRRGVALDRAARKTARRLLPRVVADWAARRAHDAVN